MNLFCYSISIIIVLLISISTINSVFASEPAVGIYGMIESGIPNQYLVAIEICAGSERFESPQIYLTSDLVTKIPIVVKAVIAKNSCTYRDYTIKANDPSSIQVGFSDTLESDSKKLKDLEKEIAELKKMIADKDTKTNKKTTKDTQDKSIKTKTTNNAKTKNTIKKPNPLDTIVISKEEIPDSRDWKVKTIQGRKGLQFNNINMDSIAGIKNRVEQSFIIDNKVFSSKEPYTFYSVVEIFKSGMVPKEIRDIPCNDCVEEIKIGAADCFTIKENYNFGVYKDETAYLCKIGNTQIEVFGLKVKSLTTNENMEKAIMKLLVEKVEKAKL